MEKKIVTPKEEMYIREAIRRQFYMQGVRSLRLSIEAIFQLIRKLHYKVQYMDIKNYLESLGYTHSITPENFSVYIYNGYDNTLVDKDIVYRFICKDFMTEAELKNFEQILCE